MSHYTARAINPRTHEIEEAMFIDDYYGHHKYGVRFFDDEVYPIEDVEIAGLAK